MLVYHVWFSTKRRKWLLQGDIDDHAEQAIRATAKRDGVRLVECKAAADHVHLMLRLDTPEELPAVMKALKGKSAHVLFQQFPELKRDIGMRNIWQRGYGWKPVKPGAATSTRRYVRTQLERLDKFER